MTRAIAWVCGRLLLLGCAAGCIPIESKPPSNTVLLIQGRLAQVPEGSGGRMTFQTETGAVYTLVSNGMSMALFVDTNLQSKLLLLKGRVRPGSQRFEVTGNLFRPISAHQFNPTWVFAPDSAGTERLETKPSRLTGNI